jgi:2-dehydropantoate 2-reductase
MHDIRTVVIFGAGAMGAVYAARFAEAPGLSVAFLARGERAARLCAEGILVNGVRLDVPVIDAATSGTAQADLVIVALKDRALAEALPDLRAVIGPETTILSVMNGLDSEAALAAAYGQGKVLYAIAVGIDALREASSVTFTTSGKIIFGEARNDVLSPRVRRVQAALDLAGLAHETPPDMVRMLWWKFMVNVGINQASAVMRAPYGVFQTDREAQSLMESLMREAITVAQHLGIDLRESDIAAWYGFLNTLSPQGKTSMLQDIEAGRPTEVEIFGGKMVALGGAHGIPTPVNETVLRIIRVLER